MKQPFSLVKDKVCLITMPDPENYLWKEVYKGAGVYMPAGKITDTK